MDWTLLNAKLMRKLAQAVASILAQNELTTVNKLKAFIAPPVDKVAKLLEAIAKLESEELESFKGSIRGNVGGRRRIIAQWKRPADSVH
jgi:hypothetical protein